MKKKEGRKNLNLKKEFQKFISLPTVGLMREGDRDNKNIGTVPVQDYGWRKEDKGKIYDVKGKNVRGKNKK